ncbi:hypothetical protein HPG69_001106, partial [Diceros bicornis minor]
LTMASGYAMMSPICLVQNQKNQLTINREALKILDDISQPVVVVGDSKNDMWIFTLAVLLSHLSTTA